MSSSIPVRDLAVTRAPWRTALRRHLAVLLLVKFAALALLWALFFSHRAPADARAVAARVAPQASLHD